MKRVLIGLLLITNTLTCMEQAEIRQALKPAAHVQKAPSLDYCKGVFKGKAICFRIRDVVGDGNCAFYVFALAFPELTRERIKQQLLDRVNDETIRNCIFPEIKSAFQEDSLPQQMKADTLYQNIRKQFFEAEAALDKLVRSLNTKYNLSPAKEAKELYEYIKTQGQSNDAQELQKLIADLENKEKLIDAYCSDLSTLANFITHSLAEKEYLGYVVDSSSTFDAIALINKFNFCIWHYKQGSHEEVIPVHLFEQIPDAKIIHILHTGYFNQLNHYKFLEPIVEPSVPAEQDTGQRESMPVAPTVVKPLVAEVAAVPQLPSVRSLPEGAPTAAFSADFSARPPTSPHEKSLIPSAVAGNLTVFKEVIKQRNIALDKEEDLARKLCETAIEHDRLSIIRYLIEECGYNFFAVNNWAHLLAKKASIPVFDYFMSVWQERNKEQSSVVPLPPLSINDNQGLLPIDYAIKQGRLSLVKHIIEHYKFDLTICNSYGHTIAHTAVSYGQFDILRYLIEERRCDVHVLNKHGNNLLYVALCTSTKQAIVEYLMQSISLTATIREIARKEEISYLRAVLLVCIKAKQLRHALNQLILQYIDEEQEDVVNNIGNHRAIIDLIIILDDVELFEYLIRKKNIIITTTLAQRLIKCAYEFDSLSIVRFLLENCGMKLSNFSDPIHNAAFYGSSSILEYYLHILYKQNSKAFDKLPPEPLTEQNENNETPLSCAIRGGRLEMVKKLVEKYKIDPEMRTSTGDTYLHYAAQYGQLTILRYFIETLGKSPNLKGHYQQSLLFPAVRQNNMRLLEYLIDNCHLSLSDKNTLQMSPLFAAAAVDNLPAVKYILNRQPERLTQRDYFSDWALIDHAATAPTSKVLTYLVEERGVSPHGVPGIITPLHAAASRRALANVKLLIEKYKVNPNSLASHKKTALMVSAAWSDIEIIQYLIEKARANIFLADEQGNNVLWYARNSLPTFQLLTEKYGADLLHFNNEGRSLLDIACAEEKGELKEYILEQLRLREQQELDKLTQAAQQQFTGPLEYLLTTVQRPTIVQTYVTLQLINQADSVTTVKHGESSLLELIARHGNAQLIQYAFEHKKPTINRVLFQRLFTIALQQSNMTLIKLIFAYSNFNPFSIGTLFHQVARSGNIEIFDYVFKEWQRRNKYRLFNPPVSPLLANDTGGLLPIDHAIQNNQLNFIKHLVENYKFDPTTYNGKGYNSTHTAAQQGKLSILRYFLETVHISGRLRTRDGQSLLHCAAQQSKQDVLNYVFLNCYPLIMTDSAGRLPLHTAALCGNLEAVLYFLNKDPDALYCTDTQGNSILHLACLSNNVTLIRYLIQDLGLSVSTKNELTGALPIHIAAAAGNVEAMQLFIKEYKVNVNARDLESQTPLMYAVANKKYNVIDYLIQESSADLLLQDAHGNSIFTIIMKEPALKKYFIDKGYLVTSNNQFLRRGLTSSGSLSSLSEKMPLLSKKGSVTGNYSF